MLDSGCCLQPNTGSHSRRGKVYVIVWMCFYIQFLFRCWLLCIIW